MQHYISQGCFSDMLIRQRGGRGYFANMGTLFLGFRLKKKGLIRNCRCLSSVYEKKVNWISSMHAETLKRNHSSNNKWKFGTFCSVWQSDTYISSQGCSEDHCSSSLSTNMPFVYQHKYFVAVLLCLT